MQKARRILAECTSGPNPFGGAVPAVRTGRSRWTGVQFAVDYWPHFWSDAEALATPLFPARFPGQGPCTAPDPRRYRPVTDDDDALCRIAEQADLFEAAGRPWLLIELTPPLFDFLLTRGGESVDDEDGGDSEPDGAVA